MEITSEPMRINKEDIIEYWLQLFPELKNEEELRNLLHIVNDLKVERVIEQIENKFNVEANKDEEIHEIIKMNLCSYLKDNTSKFMIYVPFYNFFFPIVNYQLDAFLVEISRFNIIDNFEAFIENTLKYILDSLFEISYRVIILEINTARLDGRLQGQQPIERIAYFANEMLSNKIFISSLYAEYSTLIQVLSLTVRNYFNYTLEILENTKNEWSNIEENINDGKSLGKIIKIVTGVGDGHKLGKAVSILYFTNQEKLVYKPRSLELEAGFNVLLDWLNSKEITKVLNFQKSKLYTLNDYGWMEFIENKECSDINELRYFYKRSGQFLCLLYVMNSVDFHYENLIASGEHPMLIDLESIFHAVVKSEKKEVESGYVKARKIVNSSVNTISLLPNTMTRKSGDREVSFDLSGLSMNEEQVIPIKSLFIDGIESDFIKVMRKDSKMSPQSNNPIIEGLIVRSEEYIEELKVGFEHLYMWIMENKEEFGLKIEQIFVLMKSRLIIKATAFYGQLLKIASHPDFMRESYDRKLILHRVGIKSSDEHRWMIQSEYEDLCNNDIPYFMAYINETKIINSRNEICEDLLEKTSLDAMKEKLAALSPSDLNRQLDFIEMSYFNKRTEESDLTHIKFGSYVNKLTPEKWLKVAEEIGEHILDNSINGMNDSKGKDRYWISTSLQGFEENIWKPDVLGFDIYNGNSGIALFLGYLGKILNRKDFKEASLQAMEMPKSIITSLDKSQPYSIGAFTGLSGVLYTLKKISDIHSDDENIKFIVSNMSTLLDNIKKDTVYDVIGGAAGSLGVALSLYNSNNIDMREAARKLALASYEQIINTCKHEDGMIFWPSIGSKSYSGFSHGNSGFIAYMHQLYILTGDDEILNNVKRALKFERSLFSEKDKNWYMSDKIDKVSNGWCHGAPGILLSKLILKDHGYIDKDIDNEINESIATTSLMGIGNNPTYCHGDLGNLAVLSYAAKVTKNSQLQNSSLNTYQELFENVLSKEWKLKNLKSGWSLSLMIGITGFGYSMLKNYSPELVPEFLSLE